MGLWHNRDAGDGDGTWARKVMGMGMALNQPMKKGDGFVA